MGSGYEVETRVTVCGNCGAPVQAPPQGGAVACGYCGTQSQLPARGARSTLAGVAQQGQRMGEPQRYQRLREQDGKPWMPPPALQRYLGAGGLNPNLAQEAAAEWRQLRAQLTGGGAFGTEERFYFLTLMLAQHHSTEPHHARAYVESALETVRTPRHEQVLRCTLCRNAARLGDVAAAAGWLKGCDTCSDDIHMDTAYRMSAAVLCTARGDWNGVLQQLGNDIDDVPIADGNDELVAMLRANAHERMGQLPTAQSQLQRAMQGKPRMFFDRIRQANASLELCPQSFAAVASSASQAVAAGGGVKIKPGAIIFLIFLIFPIGFVVAAIMAPEGAKTDDGFDLSMFFWFMAACFSIAPILTVVMAVVGKRRAAYFADHGLDAMGQVVSLQETGVRINKQPQVAMQIQVHHPQLAPYTITHKKVVSMFEIAQLGQQIGGTVALKVDPRNPQNVILV